MHERDGRTNTGRQQRQRLRIASRGKNPKCLTNHAVHPSVHLPVCLFHAAEVVCSAQVGWYVTYLASVRQAVAASDADGG